MSRTKNSIINFATALIGQCAGIIISFIARIFFIQALGNEYLGLNGLFTNILTMLSLAELGIGSAITYSLYEPLARHDDRRCQMLMQLYKRVYITIGLIILTLGLAITPFMPYLIHDMPDIENISLIYILFVINTAVSYFFSYKRDLIIADQKRFIATIYRYGFYFLLNVAQIIYLILTRDYIGFLILQIIATILENIAVSFHANKIYHFLTDKHSIPLDKSTRTSIIKNTRAMMMHKIGGVIVTSTDNILLSSFVGLAAVGLYSNYYMVTNGLNLFLTQIYSSVTPSIGNLWITPDTQKKIQVFDKLNFMTFWIYCFVSVTLLCLYNDFITLWVGADYLFSFDVVLALVIVFYLTGMRKPVIAFKDASGLFYKDRWKPIAESIINLAASVILALKLGTLGVFIGTIISSITTCVWVEPYVLYKYGFNISPRTYFIDYVKKTSLFTILCAVLYIICATIQLPPLLSIIVKFLICTVTANLVLFLFYGKTNEFLFFRDKFRSIIRKFRK